MVDDEGYPFLCFRITNKIGVGGGNEEGREKEMVVVGWAKRREFDDEIVDVENLTRLTEGERGRLVKRQELDMVKLEGMEDGELVG